MAGSNYSSGLAKTDDVLKSMGSYVPEAQKYIEQIYGAMKPPNNAGYGDSITLQNMAANRGQDVMNLVTMLMGLKQSQGNQQWDRYKDMYNMWLGKSQFDWQKKQWENEQAKTQKDKDDAYWNYIHGIGTGGGSGGGGGTQISWMPSMLTGNMGGGQFAGMKPFGYDSMMASQMGGGMGAGGNLGMVDYVGQGKQGQGNSNFIGPYDQNLGYSPLNY